MADQGRARYSQAQPGTVRYSQVQPGTVLKGALRILNMIWYIFASQTMLKVAFAMLPQPRVNGGSAASDGSILYGSRGCCSRRQVLREQKERRSRDLSRDFQSPPELQPCSLCLLFPSWLCQHEARLKQFPPIELLGELQVEERNLLEDIIEDLERQHQYPDYQYRWQNGTGRNIWAQSWERITLNLVATAVSCEQECYRMHKVRSSTGVSEDQLQADCLKETLVLTFTTIFVLTFTTIQRPNVRCGASTTCKSSSPRWPEGGNSP